MGLLDQPASERPCHSGCGMAASAERSQWQHSRKATQNGLRRIPAHYHFVYPDAYRAKLGWSDLSLGLRTSLMPSAHRGGRVCVLYGMGGQVRWLASDAW